MATPVMIYHKACFIMKIIKEVMMMKRTIVIILSIIASVVLIVLLTLFIRINIIPVLNIGNAQTNNPETFFNGFAVTKW